MRAGFSLWKGELLFSAIFICGLNENCLVMYNLINIFLNLKSYIYLGVEMAKLILDDQKDFLCLSLADFRTICRQEWMCKTSFKNGFGSVDLWFGVEAKQKNLASITFFLVYSRNNKPYIRYLHRIKMFTFIKLSKN